MKKLLFIFAAIIFAVYFVSGQTVVFSDDFESGTTNWTLTGNWALDNTEFHSTTNSLTEDPGWYTPANGGTGGYTPDQNTTATLATGIDLSTALDANLTYWTKYHLEPTFDFMYLDVSPDGGSTWTQVADYDEENVDWTELTVSLGGFVGNSDVKIRWRFASDGAFENDGMWIDDVEITTSTEDNAAPLIVHTPPEFYEATLDEMVFTASITDISGVASAELKYTVDGGSEQTVAGVNTTGNTYEFTVPAQAAGAWVDYYISATDAATSPNTGTTETAGYIAGIHIIQDNGVVDFYSTVGPASEQDSPDEVAVRISLTNQDIVTILIRNYTDVDHPNDDMEIHVRGDQIGMPGTDLITPFTVTPEATLSNTSAMTRVDVRGTTELENLTGDYYIGYGIPTGTANHTISQPGTFAVSFYYFQDMWNDASATDVTDYHFRAVVTSPDVSVENLDAETSVTVYPNPMVTNTKIRVKSTKDLQGLYFELYNILGEKVNADYSVSGHVIDLNRNDLAAGTYIYKLFTDNETVGQGKLVIK